MAINSAIQDSTEFSPNYLVLGTQITTPLDAVVGNESNVPAVGDFIASISRYVEAVRNQMTKYIEYQLKYIENTAGMSNLRWGARFYGQQISEASWFE